ncbi:defense against restriction DarA-related protein [Stutzerimonas nitrititolerans]|uniref:defense against restriction DarA-related protein n=1 Tax=Stutzerimonas nitrititolerans TaxID=2482751 RepID=UPI0028AF7263|nr:hypothetical protein [Stutzerimonas nitrititolerans]
MTDIFSRLQAAAHAGAFGVNELPLPSAEQCRAGNYSKGRVRLHGLPIAIEVPQGQRRMGKSDGKPWSTILMAHYGYIAGTQGADGDALDVFIGPVPESTRVWVVNQVKDGQFDEHKILMGFIDEASARAAYMNSYERGWTGLGSLIACSMFQLKWWIKYGNTKQPLTEKALPHDGDTEMNETVWDSAANPVGCDFADLIYQLRRDDSDGLMLDAVSVADIMEASEGEAALDALVVQYNKAERKAEQLRRIMESVGGDVTPAAVQVTPPFKQRGTTNVVFLYELTDGQTVSIWMHNPDSTPNKILPQDELVSWRWMLNKKDITLLVAPERGVDLNPREVSRRIIKLAQRNSARFAKANASRAERMQNIDGLKGTVAAKEAELAELDKLFADLTEKVEAKRARKPATLQTNDQEGAERTDLSTPEGQAARSKAVKEELAKLGWDATPGSLLSMVTIDGSVYSVRSDQSGKTGIVWRDEGSQQSWSDDGTLAAADMAGKIDREIREGVARARDMLNLDPTTPEGYEKATQDEALQIAHQDQLDSFFQGRIIAVRNGLRDLGWTGERYKPLSKTASNGDVWMFEPRYKQVGAGANIVEFYPQLYIYRDGKKVENENWATEDRLKLTATEMAALIDSVVPGSRAEPEPGAEPEAFRHEGFNIYPVQMRDGMRWAVQTIDNLGREQRGERQVGGDALLSTKEAAIAEADRQVLQMADIAKRAEELAAQEAEEAAAKAKLQDTDGFADQFSQVQRDRIRKTLSKNYNTSKGVMSLRDYVRVLVSEGRVISDWNGERVLEDPATEVGVGEKKLTKTGLDYAAFLIAKRADAGAEPKPEQTHSEWEGEVTELIAEKLGITTSDAQGMVEAQPFYMQQSWGKGMSAQETADKIMAESRAPENEQIQHAREFLQSVIDGQVDFMDDGLADRLEQIHDDYAGDEDVMALFGAAAQAYSDYMVEQARAALA